MDYAYSTAAYLWYLWHSEYSTGQRSTTRRNLDPQYAVLGVSTDIPASSQDSAIPNLQLPIHQRLIE